MPTHSRGSLSRRAMLSGTAAGLPLAALWRGEANASLVLAMDLAELTQASEHIVVGDVVGVEAAWDDSHSRIYSTVSVQVGERWKGLSAGSALQVVQPGGTVGDVEMRVHGLPRFVSGERAVLFLRGRMQATSLVGLGQGKRPLQMDSATRTWMVERPDRSAAVLRDARGRLLHAPDEPRMPLDEFRGRVRTLLGK